MKLNSYDRTNGVWSMAKTRQNNDVIENIGAFYAKIEIEQS